VCVFGDGMPKAKELLKEIKNTFFVEDIFPSSKSMAALAFHKFSENKVEDVAYFEPFYLKEFFTNTKT
jgi:tRNA threonylcarbamoyladenosine biosynthesis protein TsaB